MNKEKVVILGYGWVGQANGLSLAQMGYPVFYYDIAPPVFRYADSHEDLYKKILPLKELLAEDSANTWYVICVGDRVQPDGTQDLSLIKKAMAGLKSAQGGVILRSTVLPKHLGSLDFHFYVPEFLHEKHAVEECLDPHYFVVGRRNAGRKEPSFLSAWQLRAKKVFRGTPEQASHIKYLSNIWNAVRIAFINEFGNLIQEPTDRRSMLEIEQVIDFVFEKKNYLRYGKSFGGHCLPKDLLAFYTAHAENKDIHLLKAAFRSNELHKKKERNYSHLPEWFSSWDDDRKMIMNLGFASFVWQKINSWRWIRASRRQLRFVTAVMARLIPDRSLEQVGAIWDSKAKKNARYFVNTKHPKGTDVNEFDIRESGQSDYEKYIAGDSLIAHIVEGADKSQALEIGCGIGRMTEFFPRHFNQVVATDISAEMLNSAKKRLIDSLKVEFRLTDGKTIEAVPNSFDLAFSYQTLQHLPTKEILADKLQEIYRTLKPGGIAKLHLRAGRGLYKWHWAYGISTTPAEAKALSEKIGFKFLNHQAEDSKSFWVWLEK
ncbi:MAG: class I SAM-dependent methyltransferase [bacterium]|nr:class I SAM-dependent methyltransferase [bacterium]